jgi:carbon-monoxide dehydrogenase medium subunit
VESKIRGGKQMLRMLPRFEYFKPESFEEAIRILKEHYGKIRPLAGGTDLFIAMKEKGVTYEAVLDLKGIKDYDFIREANDNTEIGALASIRSIETSSIIKKKYLFLSQAAGKIGSVQVRNKATIGGNICNASPSAETAPSLIGLRAQVEIIGEKGIKVIPLEDFFIGPGQTVLTQSDLLRKIIVPPLPHNSAGVYFKHAPRRAMDIAQVGVGCILILDSDKKKCIDSRITLGAVAPIPLRAKRAEAVIIGKELTEKEIEEAGEVASQEAKPITDLRGSAEHRIEMVKVFVKRGLHEALSLIRS